RLGPGRAGVADGAAVPRLDLRRRHPRRGAGAHRGRPPRTQRVGPRVAARRGVAVSVPANPRYFGPSDRWAGHVRRYSRAELLELTHAAGLRVERCDAWGFPFSTLYHRHVYDRHIERRGPDAPRGAFRPAVSMLGLLLNVDRLFVGVERGALGYLLVARKPQAPGTGPSVVADGVV